MEKPGLCRVHRWEAETLASHSDNLNSDSEQLSVTSPLQTQTPERPKSG